MPTCTSSPKRVGTHLIESDISQLHGTVEKNKEQAYFNSYDFDAISLSNASHSHSHSHSHRIFRPYENYQSTAGRASGEAVRGAFRTLQNGADFNSETGSVKGKRAVAADGQQFLLPRAMLKYYQSAGLSPMPLAIIDNCSQTGIDRTTDTVTSATAAIHGCVSSSSSSSLASASVDDKETSSAGVGAARPIDTNAAVRSATRERSNSHYSMGKSAAGSSGYYSSNVCSTYSVEEHIYCEPVVHILESQPQSSPKVAQTLQRSQFCGDSDAATCRRPDFNEKLRILETSIANLDKHLRNYTPSSGSGSSYSHHNHHSSHERSRYGHLPTIMEGIDNSLSVIKTSWKDDFADDSLADIDLDSFLLNADYTAKAHLHANTNDYKCAQYINSCPEDAYQLDEPPSEEDQLHFETTKRMLEDLHSQIEVFTRTVEHDDVALRDHLERLRFELKAQLLMMSPNSDVEIRQLCTGLVNSEHIVKLTKAFERQKAFHNYDEIRCCTDPNFQMKSKRISQVFPEIDADCYSQLKRHNSEKVGARRSLGFQKPSTLFKAPLCYQPGESGSVLEWHHNKPSIWQLYYGTNRKNHALLGKKGSMARNSNVIVSYPSSRPESDFTLDVPRAEQLRQKLEKEKKFRQRCRMLTTFLSLIFFLLTVMIVSLILTRGKRMFGSVTW